ncbi:hypothetical protein [Streptomyces sp. NPDC046832]|uniref:hypothetical protein n=1 Tax=Streptomyces sp. NPDC046832 TaxID=3155020 RepID=UPI00340C1396
MAEPTAGTPAEDEFPQLVGTVAVESARAEFALHCMLVGLIDSQYAEIIAAGRGMEQLIDDCRALVDVHLDLDSNQKDKARALLADLKQLNTSRNKLVYSILAVDQSHGLLESSPQFTALYSKYRRPGLSETNVGGCAEGSGEGAEGQRRVAALDFLELACSHAAAGPPYAVNGGRDW